MHGTWTFRSLMFAGWFCATLMVAGAAHAAAPDDPSTRLEHADDIKTSDNVGFRKLLDEIAISRDQLSPEQKVYLHYLQAWQVAYNGDYNSAIPQLTGIMDHGIDPMVRFRAGITAVNVLAISAHNEEAYIRLSRLLEALPSISDPLTRQQALAVAALLYNQAGQYDLGLSFADSLVRESTSNLGVCEGWQLKLDALSKDDKASATPEMFQQGLDSCTKANEPVWANLIRADLALFQIRQGHPADAIKLLEASYDEAQRTNYKPVISNMDSALAQAYWKQGEAALAKTHAERAVDESVKHEITEPLVNAYRVLYEAAKVQGDASAALSWHEQYMAADKGYLDDASAHALAYQMVRQQVQEKKAQVDALSKQNQVLQLKQVVSRKASETRDLYTLLLLVVLGSIALYAYRTKRSQLKFQKLARRDGLTEIYNRQYFVEVSEHELEYCRKSVRDVSVVAIDLDHFKQINDTHGHAAGDFALRRAVVACQKHLRSVDVFGRLGGEEFGILMPDCVPERAIDLAEKMRLSIAGLAGTDSEPDFEITASFGVTAARWSGYDLLQLLAQADSALYQAKREGRNRVVAIAGPPAANSEPPPGVDDRRKA